MVAALAIVVSGCGGGGASSGLDDALSFVPKDAQIVIAIDTDTEGDQYKNLDKLIAKFPFGAQAKGSLKQKINASGKVDYDKDIKPLLGNDLVISVEASGVSGESEDTPYLVSWKVEDEDVAKRLLEKGTTKAGTAGGATIYKSSSGNAFAAIKDGTVLIARTQDYLEASIKRADGDDHMTEDQFNERLGDDLDKDALVRVTGDIEALLSKVPNGSAARKIKWVAGLRTFGAAVSVEDDGISYDSQTATEGVTETDLPLAEGEDPAPVVRRAGEIGFGIRNPAKTIRFYLAALQLDPQSYKQYTEGKAKVNKQLGIDVDRDVIDQLTGDATASVSLTGDFALRAGLADPDAMKATLEKVAPQLKKLAKKQGKSIGVSTPKGGGDGFYGIATPNGKKIAFGVVGENFVLATDAARAAQFAGQSASTVEDTNGALVFAADAGSIAKAIGAKQGQGQAAQILAGSLGDLIGSVEATTDGVSSHYKLNIK